MCTGRRMKKVLSEMGCLQNQLRKMLLKIFALFSFRFSENVRAMHFLQGTQKK